METINEDTDQRTNAQLSKKRNCLVLKASKGKHICNKISNNETKDFQSD